jgi:alpha-methylacyl-CoA racemase
MLDLGTFGPGARAARFLADYGARMIRVEPSRGPGSVQLPFYAYGAWRGFERCRIDLKDADGLTAVLDLAARADVIIEGFRPGVADRLGVGYAAVSERNPGVVYCAATGYGQTGPYAGWAGHDLNYLAVGGYLHTGGRDARGVPALPGATIADSAGGGLHAAMAIMSGLLGRAATGTGCYLDVAATDGVLGLMSMNLDEYLATGAIPGPGHGVLTGRYACYGVYECADGRFLAVGAIESKFFANLCRELGLSDWVSRQYEDGAQDELAGALRTVFAQRARDEWISLLAHLDACVAPVLSVDELPMDPQVEARGVVTTTRHPNRGEFASVGPVWAGTARADHPYAVAGDGETSTSRILSEIGYSEDRISDLAARGIVA